MQYENVVRTPLIQYNGCNIHIRLTLSLLVQEIMRLSKSKIGSRDVGL